jgi:hypothetical protein
MLEKIVYASDIRGNTLGRIRSTELCDLEALPSRMPPLDVHTRFLLVSSDSIELEIIGKFNTVSLEYRHDIG